MHPFLDSDAGRLTLAFDDLDEAAAYVEGARSENGFLVELAEELPRGRAVAVTLAGPGGFELELAAAALHVFGAEGDGYNTAFELRDWSTAKEVELRRKLAEAAAAGGGEGHGSGGETLGTSPIFRIQRMTPPEKARLALKAGRTERQILLRETSAQVMMALLNNPHLEADDVLQIVKSPYTPGSVLKRIAQERRWAANGDVRLALVRNPQTPTPLAVKLLAALPTSALKVLARGSEAREDLRQAALKIYLQRIGK